MTHSTLIVTTSTAELPGGRATGFDWASLAQPYWRLREAGVTLGFASIAGGKPPGDTPTAQGAGGETLGAVGMFLSDERAVDALARSTAIADVDPRDWTSLLFVDGLGALWDLAASDALIRLTGACWDRGGVLAAIGTGTAVLTVARDENGHALAAGRRLTCPADAAILAQLDGEEPPLLPEARLRSQGANVWIPEPDEEAAFTEDGRLITGQDARAAADVTLQLLDALDVYAPAAGREDEEWVGAEDTPPLEQAPMDKDEEQAERPGMRTPS